MGTSRHSMLRRMGAILLAGGVAAGLAAAPAAVLAGSVITVNSLANVDADDGDCTLREAITAANTDTASGATTGECVAGSGTDTIVFNVGGTISVTGTSQLPGILEDATIDGAREITIDGSNDTSTGLCVCLGATATIKGLKLQAFAGTAIAIKGSATVQQVELWANGQGIQVAEASNLTLVNGNIHGNEGTSGAGIYVNEGSTASITRSQIWSNSAVAEGGGIRMVGSTVTINQSEVIQNGASKGAGIYMESPTAASTLKVYNSTIGENVASDQGGGIFRDGNIDLRNVTIAKNTATNSGGGVETDGTGWTLILKNAAILGNTANAAASDWANGLPNELANNAVSSLVGLHGKTFGDYFSPAALADNGGDVRTFKPKVVAGNPLVDGGNATVCATAPINGKDERGYGRVNPCDIGSVDVDRTKPVVSGARTSLRQGESLSGTSSRARVTWNASDSGSGIARYTIQRRIDGGSWSTLATGLTSKAYDVTLSRSHDYAFRVRAVDKEGNVGSYSSSASFEARLYQQTSTAFTYGGSWGTSSAASYSGGSTRRSTTSGSSARFTATGRSFAWVTTTGPTRGKAKVYVNGTLVATIDLHADTTSYRVQAWSKTYSSSASRTIRIVVSGTGKRVDLDAFAVLR